MHVQAPAATGPFRGALPFDETGTSVFSGRQAELQMLAEQVITSGSRVVVLAGEMGVGKTSLLRAGLLPMLASNGILGLYLGDYSDLENELVQSASRVRAEPPAAGESPAAYTTRLALQHAGGVVLLLDHLEEVLRDDAPPEALVSLTNFLRDVLGNASQPSLRLVFSIESASYPRLGRFLPRSVLSATGATLEIARLPEDRVAQIIEQTVLQTGTFIEQGLAQLAAADLCRTGPCLPIDLQIVARTIMDLRLTSIRRYERSGGAAVLGPTFFERVVREAGGRGALKVLLDLHDSRGRTFEEISQRTRLSRAAVEHALSTFVARGVLGKRDTERGGHFVLLHPALQARIADFGAIELGRARRVRRMLTQRSLSRGRLSVPDLFAVTRHLAGALDPAEQKIVQQSVRRKVFHVSIGALVAIAFAVVLYVDQRTSYTLRLDPPDGHNRARIVVVMGKPDRGIISMLPHSPAFGSILADTGFSASGLSADLVSRVKNGHATGKLGRSRNTNENDTIPDWLRTTLAGLQPVRRGTAAVLLGDPSGVLALKQAFADPAARSETLEVLRIVGVGGAGEDEILAASLATDSPELRLRAVAVAAAIDRRTGKASHATTLRSALSDESPLVREAVVKECATLPPSEASDVLRIAIKSADPELRKLSEQAILALAIRAPVLAAQAAKVGAADSDSMLRKNSMELLAQIAAHAAAATAPILADLVRNEQTPEDTRIAALQLLRGAGTELGAIADVIARAAAADAPPRLRAAALPLHARLIPPDEAERIAQSEARGPVLSRAAATAIWGALAEQKTEAAAKAIKVALFDSAPEVRAEGARAAGNLRRDGVALIQRALLDPNAEVQKAALEAAVTIGKSNTFAAIELLTKAIRLVRPTLRPAIVDALGQAGAEKPQLALPGIIRAFKEGNVQARVQVAQTLCTLTAKDPVATSPFLRLAARDTDRDVRSAAATCLAVLAKGDPKGAVRMANDLSAALEAPVRAATAAVLPALVQHAGEESLGLIFTLLADMDSAIRTTATQAFIQYAKSGLKLGTRTEDANNALRSAFSLGAPSDRVLVVEAAAAAGLRTLLRTATRDGDDVVQVAALQAAARLNPPEIDLVQAATLSPSATVRAEAMKLLVASSDKGAADVLPIFESMLRSPDPAEQESAALSLGGLIGAEAGATATLERLLTSQSERQRRAAVVALARVAARNPSLARPILERALDDPAHDVRAAAAQGLAVAWAGERTPEAIAAILEQSEADSRRRLVALESLVQQSRNPEHQPTVRKELERIAESGPPLARLAARVGLAFLQANPDALATFIHNLFGN